MPEPPPTSAYFGHGYYHLYRQYLLPDEQTRAEAAFLVRRLRPRPGQRWLDLPCGYGRHLKILRRLAPGPRLFGGDLNRQYLREPGLGRAAALSACDMRRLPFADGAFDVVLNLLNSFGYFPPEPARTPPRGDRAVLAEFARVLRPGGRLVMDLPNRRALVALVRRQPVIRYCGGQYEATETFAWDDEQEVLANRTDWRWPGGRERASYRLRLYTPAQIRRLLTEWGFEVREVFGDFSGSPFSPYDSDRMLVLARRNR